MVTIWHRRCTIKHCSVGRGQGQGPKLSGAATMTIELQVFDPPMCCPTGVCGPAVDPALAIFAADLAWLEGRGAAIQRHNLAQEPQAFAAQAFAAQAMVQELLERQGEEALPLILVEGEILSSGRYPSRQELADRTTRADDRPALDPATSELVVLGAAIGANCEPCFKFHYDQSRRLGIPPDSVVAAVRLAQRVKDAPARSMIELAARLL
jgi:AhpD family alkylhydroperoxidase